MQPYRRTRKLGFLTSSTAKRRRAQLCLVLSILTLGCASAPSPNISPPIGTATEAEPTGDESSAEALLPNGRIPQRGVLTGGAPSREQLHALRERGYRTVVSLLPDHAAEASAVNDLGMEFVAIPVAGPQDLTEANARSLSALLEQDAKKPMVLHCASGNRAGALLALAAFYGQGRSKAEALALGKAAGLTSLAPVVEEKLGLVPQVLPADDPATP